MSETRNSMAHTPFQDAAYSVVNGMLYYKSPTRRANAAEGLVAIVEMEPERAQAWCELLNNAHAKGALDLLAYYGPQYRALLAAAKASYEVLFNMAKQSEGWSEDAPLLVQLREAIREAEGSPEPEPPHSHNCICADCSGAELTADND